MKRAAIFLSLLVLIIPLMGGCSSSGAKGNPMASASTNERIPVEVALESVREFLGDPEAQLDLHDIETFPIYEAYVFTSEKYDIYVNTKSGEVVRAHFWGISNPEVKIDLAQAEAIARDFAQKHYSDFDEQRMPLCISKFSDHGTSKEYEFLWQEFRGKASVPNLVKVSISPATGQVMSYMGWRVNVTISTKPKIDRNAALRIATDAVSFEAVMIHEVRLSVWFDEEGNQVLHWSITLEGEPSKHFTVQGAEVVIDAFTGEIVRIGPMS